MLIHVKIPWMIASTLLGINTSSSNDPHLSFVKMKEMKLISPTGHDCLISRCLLLPGCLGMSACVCVQALVGVCVLSSTDISSNVVDISRGFEDLIPSVFEELCAALLITLRETLQQSPQRALPSGPWDYSIWSTPSSFTHSVIRRRSALYIACLLEMTSSLLGLLLSLAVFP